MKFKFTSTLPVKANNQYQHFDSGYPSAGVESPAVPTDNTQTTLFSGLSTTDFDLYGDLVAKMTLHAPAAQATQYNSTITWTAGANTATPVAK